MSNWYAVKTAREFELLSLLEPRCEETYIPVETVMNDSGKMRKRPIIPRILFIRCSEKEALSFEAESHLTPPKLPSLWIYRYKKGEKIQPIRQEEMELFRLLTADKNDLRCEIFRKEDFRKGDRVRVIAGPFAGYEGYINRIRKNKHVVVEIEGLCALALPFIHPDLLEKID